MAHLEPLLQYNFGAFDPNTVRVKNDDVFAGQKSYTKVHSFIGYG